MIDKPGVVIEGLGREIRVATDVCAAVYARWGVELVRTSGMRTGAGQLLHSVGRAVDLRLPSRCDRVSTVQTNTIQEPETFDRFIASLLARELGPDFDVVLEVGVSGGDHIHVELDPK
jgi:hypothetical protein